MRMWLALSMCYVIAGSFSEASAASTFFSTDWESGTLGWTSTGAWVLGAGLGDDPGAYSADNYWFAPTGSTVSSDFLTSPTYTLPDADAPALSFVHHYDMECSTIRGYDGGVIEISVNGGAFQYVPSADYDMTMSSSYLSPIGGLEAFTGLEGGSSVWVMETVDLSSFAGMGDTVQVRFHQADDNSVGGDGWYIDDLTLATVPEPGTMILLSLATPTVIRRRR